MTKSINFKAFKGYPFTIKTIGKGYFDFSNSYFKSQDADLNIDSEIKPYSLSDYGSIKYVEPSKSAASVISSASLTPNYMELPENRSVMLPFRDEKYYDVGYDEPMLINNGCTISDDNIAEGFSSSNKITIDKTFPSSVTTAEFTTRAQFTDSSSHSCLFGRSNSSEQTIIVRSYNSKFYFASYASTWYTTDDAPAIELNKYYWFKTIWDGTNTTGYMLEDNSYTKDTLPEISSWTQCWQHQIDMFSDATYDIGFNYFSTSEYTKGSIDLANSEIKVNDEVFWNINQTQRKSEDCYGNLYDYTDTGDEKTLGCWFAERNSDKERFLLLTDKDKLSIDGYTTRWLADKTIPAHDVYDYSENVVQGGEHKTYTLNGKVTADKNDVVTNFGSSSNYVSLDCPFPKNAGVWKFVTHVKSSESYGTGTRFLVSDVTDASGHFGIALGTNSSGQVWVFLSSTGQSYDIASGVAGSTSLEKDKDYWIKLEFTGTRYLVYLSEVSDFSVSSLEISIDSSEAIFYSEANMVIGVHGGNYSSTNMTQYLRDTYLLIKGNEAYWKLQYSVPQWTKK